DLTEPRLPVIPRLIKLPNTLWKIMTVQQQIMPMGRIGQRHPGLRPQWNQTYPGTATARVISAVLKTQPQTTILIQQHARVILGQISLNLIVSKLTLITISQYQGIALIRIPATA